MKIFLLGNSGCGKSPFARMLREQLPHLEFNTISAGAWVRPFLSDLERKPDASIEERNHFIQEATSRSIAALKQDRKSCTNQIDKELGEAPNAIIDGVRNPHDFSHLFDYDDLAVFITRNHNPYRATQFEQGLIVIKSYLDWLLSLGLISQRQVIQVTHSRDDLESSLGEVLDYFSLRTSP